MAEAHPEAFGSSGSFDERGPQSKEETLDLDIFTKPKGPGEDATVEEIFAHDPVADSEAVWKEAQQKAQAEADARKEVEGAAQIKEEAAAAQREVESLFDPAANPIEPTPGTVLPGTPAAPAPGAPQVPAPQVPVAPDELALLKAQNEALQAQLTQFMRQPPAAPVPAPAQYAQQQVQPQPQVQPVPYGQPAQPAPEPLPNYQYQIAPQLVEAIRSEDPNVTAQGLSALVHEVASAVHTQVRQEYRGYVDQNVPRLAEAQYAQQNARESAQKQLREDFFSTYPQFGEAGKRNPLDPVIATVTGTVMQELNMPEWNDVVKNTVAYRLHTILGGQHVAPAAGGVPQQVAGVSTPQPAQAALAAPGTRAGGGREASPALKEHYEVADLFFGGSDHPTGAF